MLRELGQEDHAHGRDVHAIFDPIGTDLFRIGARDTDRLNRVGRLAHPIGDVGAVVNKLLRLEQVLGSGVTSAIDIEWVFRAVAEPEEGNVLREKL